VQLHQPRSIETLAHARATIVVVSFATPERLTEWVPYFREHFLEASVGADAARLLSGTRFATDPERAVYRAYGLGRHAPRAVYSLKVLLQYARWALEGRAIRKASEDTLQKGGDFVVGRDGRLRLSHVGSDQSERPAVADVLAALDEGSHSS
jgi:hypothetical protein